MEGMNASNPFGPLLASMREFSLESDRYVERVAALHGLHRTDLNALGYLIRPGLAENAMTPGKLGDALHLSSPATTALVDRLERSGHVNRKRSETDRRQVELAMTEHARTVGRELFAPLAARMATALANYSPEELAVVQRFLTEMTDATVEAKNGLSAPQD
ncbi:hypothetical protein AL755_00465 (plasmid) [Arthrobacter sp. ERGS1:01]|nr:hypothetical protein AL755_00465 [Arthrobacter sp. ERGS1:01]